MKHQQALSIIIMVLLLGGCTHMGPKTVSRDRFDYNTAISDSWKEQTLLNIVKIRYADMPHFVEVASIVSGYTLEGSVNLNGNISSEDSVTGKFLSMGTAGKYTDRPTITYAPITGKRFHKSFMTPIPPWAILFLMQTGWPADLLFPITVDALNGFWSQVPAGVNMRKGDPEFYRVIALLRKLQVSGAVGMRVLKESDEKKTTVMLFYRNGLTPETDAALKEFSSLLNLQPEGKEIGVSYGLKPEGNREIAMLTRSILHIMVDMASQIDVPPRHVKEGRTVSSQFTFNSIEEKIGQTIRVKNSIDKPKDAFTAVNYKDYWFWIDDRDFNSKRAFAFLMILFSLTETSGQEGLPLVTIPTG